MPFHIGEATFGERAGELLELSGQLARSAADASPLRGSGVVGVPPMFGSYQPDKFDTHRAGKMMGVFLIGILPLC